MYTKWTSHLNTKEEKEAFERDIKSSKSVLERLMQLIDEDERNLDRVEMNVKAFEMPNWPYRQAFYNGSRSAYSALKKLIDLDQQKQKEITDDQSTGRYERPTFHRSE